MSVSMGGLGRVWDGDAYSDYGARCKAKFHSTGTRRLRKLAALIGLAPGTFDVRSNKGGIAVSGEITLHGEHIYVQALHSVCGGPIILVRACNGRRDYTGRRNHTVRGWGGLDNRVPGEARVNPIDCLDTLAAFCRHVAEHDK